MKLMTLNAHSLAEADYPQKLTAFVRAVLAEQPDVIALQESSQTIAAPVADASLLTGQVPVQQEIPVRADNHAANAARLLRQAGIDCSWAWLPVKVGYGIYDEGLAILSLRRPIVSVRQCRLSRSVDYAFWKTRRALAVQIRGCPDWFCTVHMGWWQDEEEPFSAQWQALETFAEQLAGGSTWLMGDFNAPAETRGEGYDLIAASGWHDTCRLAQKSSDTATIPGKIDGWRDGPGGGLRIDHIWCSRPVPVTASRTLFTGADHPVVSDHRAVLIETESAGLK